MYPQNKFELDLIKTGESEFLGVTKHKGDDEVIETNY